MKNLHTSVSVLHENLCAHDQHANLEYHLVHEIVTWNKVEVTHVMKLVPEDTARIGGVGAICTLRDALASSFLLGICGMEALDSTVTISYFATRSISADAGTVRSQQHSRSTATKPANGQFVQ